MPFRNHNDAENRLRDPAPLSELEIRDLMEWMPVLSQASVRRLDTESALQALTAIRHFDESSGKIGVWGLALNIALFVLTIIAVFISIASFRDANKSAQRQEKFLSQQQDALDASRKALESAVAVAEKQTALMQNTLNTSESQLKITREQYRREMEQPDAEAFLIYPQAPSVIVHNRSKLKVARDIRYEARFWNLDKPTATGFELVSSRVGNIDFSRADSTVGPNPFELFSGQGSPASLVDGERLFGTVTLQCPDCAVVRIYWAYIEVGKKGFYREGKWNEFDWYHLSSTNIKNAIGSLLESKGLIQMPLKYP